MATIVYSIPNKVSLDAADAMKRIAGFQETEPVEGMRRFKFDKLELIEIKEMHLNADFLDKLNREYIIFLSSHGSAKNIPCFTAHPEGNWNGEAKLGGKPKELAFAAPVQMQKVLAAMAKGNKTEIPVTYEATHHGPLLKTPSLFAEVGGNDETRGHSGHLEFLARSVLDSFDMDVGYEKVAFGIGGLHYSDRFAKLAVSGKYAFGHIMSKHHVDNIDMIPQAIERSSPKPEVAVIDWKSLYAEQREKAINKLNEAGLDYAKI